MKIRLNCQHAATCLSDYWSGHHLAHICIPVYRGMSPAAVRAALHSELNQGAVMGSDDRTRDDSGYIGDAWFKAAHAAVNRDVKPARKGTRQLFMDLEPETEDSESVCAYFVFTDSEA